MRKLLVVSAACALFACSDGKDTKPTPGADAGAPDSSRPGPGADADVDPTPDAGGGQDAGDAADAGTDGAASPLSRPPGSLERPPTDRLPDDLRPPQSP